MYKIEISERTLHFKVPAGTSRGVYTTRHSFFLTLSSDEVPGVKGVGECATLPDLSCDAKPEYEATLRQVCQLVEQMGRIPYDMIRAYPSITFGLESAFADFFHQVKVAATADPSSVALQTFCSSGLGKWLGKIV